MAFSLGTVGTAAAGRGTLLAKFGVASWGRPLITNKLISGKFSLCYGAADSCFASALSLSTALPLNARARMPSPSKRGFAFQFPVSLFN